MKKLLGCLSMAALAILLAAPVSAQTITLTASVPFSFIVGGRTMPAGEYVLSTDGYSGALAGEGPLDGDGAFLTFNRYGGDYFLAGIWDRSNNLGCSVPLSRTEREKAKSASSKKPELVMVLARR